MKKLILTIIYIIPLLILVVALGQNSTSNNNKSLKSETAKKPSVEIKSDDSQETSNNGQTDQSKNNENNIENKIDNNYSSNDVDVYNENTYTKIKIPDESDTCINILLICTTSNDSNFENIPDKFSVCSIDSTNNKITLIPIPYNTHVKVPNIGYTTLSNTYTWGDSTDLLLNTIKSEFGASITKVVEVNTESVPQISRTLKDMEININEEKILEYINETKISKSMIEDFKSIPIYMYPKLVNCMKPYIKTNIDTTSLIRYGLITYKILINQ